MLEYLQYPIYSHVVFRVHLPRCLLQLIPEYGVLINHTLQNDAEQEDINVRLKAVVKLWYGVDGASKGTMASGSLPLDTYHRASQVGSGTYGTVVTVYNEEGEQFALKLFVEDDEDGEDENNWASRVIDLGALREISCLRLFRHKNSHQNIIEIADVQTEFDDGSEAGAGTAGCLGMAMPLYSGGSLLAAIAKKSRFSRSIKVSIAHGILSAVAHLHENGWVHRDIKSDNILLENLQESFVRAILIDFSLAKLVDGSMYGDSKSVFANEQVKHTGEVGTVTYTAPEVVARETYGKPSDIWSVGVVLLELLLDKELEATKNREAHQLVKETLDTLPDQPFPNLIRGMLQTEASKRLTASDALRHPIFEKFGLASPPKKLLAPQAALPYDDVPDSSNVNKENTSSLKSGRLRKDPTRERRAKAIRQALAEIGSDNVFTANAALEYCQQFSDLDDDLDDFTRSQSLLDCVVLAHRFFEVQVLDLAELDENDRGTFAKWDLDQYIENEETLFMMMDFCLYPRHFVD